MSDNSYREICMNCEAFSGGLCCISGNPESYLPVEGTRQRCWLFREREKDNKLNLRPHNDLGDSLQEIFERLLNLAEENGFATLAISVAKCSKVIPEDNVVNKYSFIKSLNFMSTTLKSGDNCVDKDYAFDRSIIPTHSMNVQLIGDINAVFNYKKEKEQ